MQRPKSPFLVTDQLLSIKQCEYIVDKLNPQQPNIDAKSKTPVMTVIDYTPVNDLLVARAEAFLSQPLVNDHFGTSIIGVKEVRIEWYPQNHSSVYARHDTLARDEHGEWQRLKDGDFIITTFLSQFNTHPPFDSDFEVYGGKLEFPSFAFGFSPMIGKSVIYPCAPNFVNGVSSVSYGDCFLIKMIAVADKPYQYNPANFPGTYREWF